MHCCGAMLISPFVSIPQRQNTTASRGAIEIKLERDVVRSSHPSDDLRRDEYELEKISTRYPTGGLSGGTAPSFEPPGARC